MKGKKNLFIYHKHKHLRLLKKTNTHFYEQILSELSKSHKISSVSYADGYLAPVAPNHICYFKLKGLSNWRFGIRKDYIGWNEESTPSVVFYGEHVDFIDKFKPSAVAICHENISDFIDTVKSIKSNEVEFIKNTYCYDDYSYEDYISEELDKLTKENKIAKLLSYTVKQIIANNNNISAIGLSYEWKDKFYSRSCNPKYLLHIVVDDVKDLSDGECEVILDYIGNFNEILEKQYHYDLKFKIDVAGYLYDDVKDLNKVCFRVYRKEKSNV